MARRDRKPMTRTNRRYDLSLAPAHGRRRRQWVAAFGMWVVLFNIVAAALAGAVLRGEKPAAAGFADTMVICAGLGSGPLDGEGKPADSRKDRPLCPFCLPMMQGQLDIPVAVAAPAAPVAVAVLAERPRLRLPPAPARAIRAAPARAPPCA